MLNKLPRKAEIQQSFVARCKKEGLTSQQVVEHASFIPIDSKTKVLHWPKL